MHVIELGSEVKVHGRNKQKTIGEALRIKGRNPIESVRYKRKVTTAEKEDRKGEEKHGRETNIERKGPKGAEAPKGKNP